MTIEGDLYFVVDETSKGNVDCVHVMTDDYEVACIVYNENNNSFSKRRLVSLSLADFFNSVRSETYELQVKVRY